MTLRDPESITDFKKSSDLLKWIHNDCVMNLSVVIINSIVHSIIKAFFSSLSHSIQKGEFQLTLNHFVSTKNLWCNGFFKKDVLFDLSNMGSGVRSE